MNVSSRVFLGQLGHPVHRPLELDDLPVPCAGFAVQPPWSPGSAFTLQLVDPRALGQSVPRCAGCAVALDVDDAARLSLG